MFRISYGRLVVLALIASLFALLFRGLVQSYVPAFRDGLYFYYPQAVWLDEQANQSNYFPSWNAREGLGVSVAGQPSSGLYYPMRILWHLPWLSIGQRYALVIAVHLLIAALGMRWCADRLGLSSHAQWIAAIAYALSCPVLFQHCNLIYLCSAAWLGFGLGSILPQSYQSDQGSLCARWQQQPLWLALACSLMLLAGDPHTAANLILLMLVVFGWELFRAFSRKPRQGAAARQAMQFVVVSGLLIFIATAIQWLPAARWSWHSDRVERATVSEAVNLVVADAVVDRVLRESAGMRRHVYDFSVGPWYALTLIWPTLGGHYEPENSRLFVCLPAEGRMWLPSLYVGIIPMVLAVRAVWRQGRDQRVRWLMGLLIVATLATLGSYSPVWLLKQVLMGVGLRDWSQWLPRDSVGSLYWILVECVPGYGAFRYPGKWSVWLAAALSLLGALGFDSLRDISSIAKSRVVRVTFGLSLAGLLVSAICWWLAGQGIEQAINNHLATHATDRLLGAPTTSKIAGSLLFAFGSPALVLGLIVWLPVRRGWLAIITLVEMCLVASHWLVFAPAPTALPASLPPLPTHLTSNDLLWCPAEVSLPNGKPQWLGRLGLLSDARFFNSPQSIEPQAMVKLRSWLVAHDRLRSHDPELEEVLRALGVTHRLVRSDADVGDELQWQAIEQASGLCEVRDATNARIALAWIEHQWLSSDQLYLHVSVDQPATLIVRQYNDGGWSIVPADANRPSVAAHTIAQGKLFVEVDLPSGEHRLVLKRNRFW